MDKLSELSHTVDGFLAIHGNNSRLFPMVLHFYSSCQESSVNEIRQAFEACGVANAQFDFDGARLRASLPTNLSDETLAAVVHAVAESGHELLPARNAPLVGQIKESIHEMLLSSNFAGHSYPFVKFLATRMKYNYRYLSRIFSRAEGMTVEHFVLVSKIERTKELLDAGNISLADIAFELNFSSVPHLSKQFKAITGQTIREYRATHCRSNGECAGHEAHGAMSEMHHEG